MSEKANSIENKKIGYGIFIICLLIVMIILFGSLDSGGLVWFIVIIGLVGGFYGIIQEGKVQAINLQEMKDEYNQLLSNLPDFKATNIFMNDWGLLIAIDDVNKKIVIKTKTKKLSTYNYNDILSCEVLEDDISIYKKSTTRTVGGAVLGGVIAGGAGAVVGGLSGQQTKNKKYKNIQLKLVMKDTSNPNIFISFFDVNIVTSNTKQSIDESESIYGPMLKTARKQVNKWKDIITIIIDKVDNDHNSKDNLNDTSNSIADELLKLNELKEKGILTEEEFIEQKNNLLKTID